MTGVRPKDRNQRSSVQFIFSPQLQTEGFIKLIVTFAQNQSFYKTIVQEVGKRNSQILDQRVSQATCCFEEQVFSIPKISTWHQPKQRLKTYISDRRLQWKSSLKKKCWMGKVQKGSGSNGKMIKCNFTQRNPTVASI